ncbi:hypothetical protein O1611_g10137 [Lasiodiplodia mahajangana]|uniref:Uncharacterized protein n=1 Tax=Lasiodiplodia mahajangana TaxID=1108764 RepID=A0ACC2J1K1_9PEZI|nr:hypothetical protein O1611_g10137 [Lasiodiplodia mahajangana]
MCTARLRITLTSRASPIDVALSQVAGQVARLKVECADGSHVVLRYNRVDVPEIITRTIISTTVHLQLHLHPHHTSPRSLENPSFLLFTSIAMHLLGFLGLASLVLGVQAEPFAKNTISKRCTNSAEDRTCWGDYDIDTNYYDESPDTGVTREYWFDIVNTTAAPDGVERVVLSVNGSVPGPTIIADWGDTVVVHVTNSMENNGTGIHFHGIRQNYTNQNDGVPSLTQCPIAPGSSYTYTWKATQYGSSWYHSHFYVQAWDGVFGGILINGPATANYDEDLGTLILSDWSHETADVEVLSALANGPPTLENGLINGTNVYDDAGSRFETTFVSGTSYRLRLVNAGADTHFKFTIDNHTMQPSPWVSVTISLLLQMRPRITIGCARSPRRPAVTTKTPTTLRAS